MIPRHQTVLFVVLVGTSAIMGTVLWRQLDRAHQRLLQALASTPTQAPQVAPAEEATLLVANDADNSLLTRPLTLPLPQNPEARGRAVLGKLLDLYAAPDATHPVPGGAASVAQVFLLPVPPGGTGGDSPNASGSHAASKNAAADGPELAVVNLTATFAASHPSGLETETLTILSMCATLHANLPDVAQVRFLVDGKPRATLAGHADLTRTYLAAEAVPTEGAHP